MGSRGHRLTYEEEKASPFQENSVDMSQAPQLQHLEIKSSEWEETGETFRKHAPNESETLKTHVS